MGDFCEGLLMESPPNYESYDYSRDWHRKKLNDLAEKAIIRSWIKPARTCLELGTGFGRITKILQSQFDDIVSLDFSRRNLATASKSIPHSVASFIRADIRNLPCESDLFDFIIMIRVAHHLSDPSIVLNEICRVAKNRATVIISLPNPLLSEARKHNRSVHIYTGESGHKIYSTPFSAYSHDRFFLLERRGTGIFENRIAEKFEFLPYLHLADVATSQFWFLKKTLFLRFEIRK